MSKSFIKSTKAKVLILTILVLAMVTMLFGGYAVSAETNEDTVQELAPQPRNQSSMFNLDCGGKVFVVEVTAANYIWPSADRFAYKISARDGYVPTYTYTLDLKFYDESGNIKFDYGALSHTVSRNIDEAILCDSGWPWAADYVVFEMSITYNGETKTTGSVRLYFWD